MKNAAPGLSKVSFAPVCYRQVRNLALQGALRRRGHHEVVVRRGVDRVGAEVHLVRAAVPFGQSLLASLRTVASGPCLSWTSSGVASLVGTLVGTLALCGPARI